MFEHVKVKHIGIRGAWFIELSCPENNRSAEQHAPPKRIRFECEHVTAGFDAQLDDPVRGSYITSNLYERWKTD